MAELRDPRALLRHAAHAGDLDLVGLVGDRLARDGPRNHRSRSAVYAYMILVRRLGLLAAPADEPADDR
jgi:hypothetical protein